jgi:hypothetical protein
MIGYTDLAVHPYSTLKLHQIRRPTRSGITGHRVIIVAQVPGVSPSQCSNVVVADPQYSARSLIVSVTNCSRSLMISIAFLSKLTP